jgi:hypothetical protein
MEARVKKVAIGCLVLVVVLGVLGAVGSYFVYRKVKSTVAEFSELGRVPEIERGVRNTVSYTPPESGELTSQQVERYVRVQDAVRARLGASFDEMERQYKDLLEKKEAGPLDLPQLIAAYRDLAKTYISAKQAQVDALNTAGFSLQEYSWVRRQVYAALGLPIMDIDVARIVEDIRSGQTPPDPSVTLGGSIGPSGPEKNRELVEPHKKTLEDNAPLAMFGL